MLVLIFLFFYVVGYHSRLVEVTSRLDFLWKRQAAQELADISETRTYNTQLLKNILPDHVANYFLAAESGERRTDVSWFPTTNPDDHSFTWRYLSVLGIIFSSQRWGRSHVCQVFNFIFFKGGKKRPSVAMIYDGLFVTDFVAAFRISQNSTRRMSTREWNV